MKLYEQISDETYSCGICSHKVKKGEYHHNHDNFINGRLWGWDALKKWRPYWKKTRTHKMQHMKENPKTKEERYEDR